MYAVRTSQPFSDAMRGDLSHATTKSPSLKTCAAC